MVPLVFFAASCFVGGKKIHVRKRQEATVTSLPTQTVLSACGCKSPPIPTFLVLIDIVLFSDAALAN